MGNLKYKGYVGSAEYSEEDNCLFGLVHGFLGSITRVTIFSKHSNHYFVTSPRNLVSSVVLDYHRQR